MSENPNTPQGSEVAKTLLKDYFNGVKKLESLSTMSFVSLIISILFVSKVFGYFILNVAYLINVSFFALIVRDSWVTRKRNIIPLVAIIVSIALTAMLLVDVLKAIDMFASFGRALEEN